MNTETFKFEIIQNPSSKDLDFLTQKINEETTAYGSAYPFAILVRDEKKSIIAGCNGSIVFGSIYTDQLWVQPAYRKKGLGRQLMEAVHTFGRQQGCTLATVATMSFQVPNFYQKLGYKVDFSRQGYHKGSTCIFLSKPLNLPQKSGYTIRKK